MRKEKPLLKIKITAPGLRKGHIPIPLLVKICAEAQAAINRQAEALAGERSLRRGPVLAEIARDCTLDLVRLGEGPQSAVRHLCRISVFSILSIAWVRSSTKESRA